MKYPEQIELKLVWTALALLISGYIVAHHSPLVYLGYAMMLFAGGMALSCLADGLFEHNGEDYRE